MRFQTKCTFSFNPTHFKMHAEETIQSALCGPLDPKMCAFSAKMKTACVKRKTEIPPHNSLLIETERVIGKSHVSHPKIDSAVLSSEACCTSLVSSDTSSHREWCSGSGLSRVSQTENPSRCLSGDKRDELSSFPVKCCDSMFESIIVYGTGKLCALLLTELCVWGGGIDWSNGGRLWGLLYCALSVVQELPLCACAY